MIENSKRKSSEICFGDDFQLYEEREFKIWNHNKQIYENYIIRKEENDLYMLFFKESNKETSIFDFYGIWSDIPEEEMMLMEDSIKNLRKRISNKYQ